MLGDVVVPDKPADAVTPVDAEYDLPDTVDDQLRWMAEAGLTATVAWQCGDLAVMVAERTS